MESAESSFWIAWLQGGGRLEVNLGDWAISGDAIGSARQTDRQAHRQTDRQSVQTSPAQSIALFIFRSIQFAIMPSNLSAQSDLFCSESKAYVIYFYRALLLQCAGYWTVTYQRLLQPSNPAGQSVKWDVYGLGWHIIWAILRLSNSNMVLFSPLLAALFPYIRYFVRA